MSTLLELVAVYLLGVAGGRVIAREHPEPVAVERRTVNAILVIAAVLLAGAFLIA